MKPSRLLKMMFETDRWQNLLDNATEKGIELKIIKELCYPKERKKLYTIIKEDKYNIFPPRIARIPKENGKYIEIAHPDREVKLTFQERKNRVLKATEQLFTFEQLGHYDLAGKLGCYINTREWAIMKINMIEDEDIEGIESWEKYFGITSFTKIIKGKVERIPEYREVYINEPRDRIVLTLINDCVMELFKNMIHPQCRSYQKRTGTQMIVKEISSKICKIKPKTDCWGVKADYSKYFDNVRIEAIDSIFDEWEHRLGFEKGTEPVINLLRRYYHQDLFFDVDGTLKSRYQGLKQGCAVASALANMVLYEVDEYMSNKYTLYYRYSDDSLVVDEDTSHVVEEMNELIEPYGISLNPKKVEKLYPDKWFKFLGFNIKGSMITLSATRVKKFQKEIEKRSINRKKKNKKFTGRQAKKEIVRFLYEGEYNWSSSCLGTINVEPDIQELNKFIIDCIKACDTGKLKIGGLGSVNNLPDRTILRGKGKNVRANRDKIEHIENYLSVDCLRK